MIGHITPARPEQPPCFCRDLGAGLAEASRRLSFLWLLLFSVHKSAPCALVCSEVGRAVRVLLRATFKRGGAADVHKTPLNRRKHFYSAAAEGFNCKVVVMARLCCLVVTVELEGVQNPPPHPPGTTTRVPLAWLPHGPSPDDRTTATSSTLSTLRGKKFTTTNLLRKSARTTRNSPAVARRSPEERCRSLGSTLEEWDKFLL